jgi:hypothetical protein
MFDSLKIHAEGCMYTLHVPCRLENIRQSTFKPNVHILFVMFKASTSRSSNATMSQKSHIKCNQNATPER